MLDLGDVYRASVEIRDAAGTLANADTVTVTVTRPDGSTELPATVGPLSTGVYEYDYTATQAGRHTVRWLALGTNAGSYVDTFEVADVTQAVALADLKRHLNITGSTQDAELSRKLKSAEGHVARLVGPLTPEQATETYPAGALVLLRRLPVLSVEFVTFDGVAQTYRLNADAGLLTFDWRAYGTVEVTYTAGFVTVPADVAEAVLRVAAGLWRSQRGASPLPLQGGDSTQTEGNTLQFASLIDASARELLAPYLIPPSQVA